MLTIFICVLVPIHSRFKGCTYSNLNLIEFHNVNVTIHPHSYTVIKILKTNSVKIGTTDELHIIGNWVGKNSVRNYS